MKPEKGIDRWLSEPRFCSSVSSIWTELILCMNTRCNGSSISSLWECKLLLKAMNTSNDWRIWMSTSRFLCTKMCVEVCLKDTNCSLVSCLQSQFNKETIKLLEKNGDTYLPGLQETYRFLKTKRNGLTIWPGMIFINRSMERTWSNR